MSQVEIIPSALAIRAMRDSGYKDTNYALAEIIDNSIQAGANVVELICVEAKELVNNRERKRISSIGILDNGVGMSEETLRNALQFGNGTHLNDREGIGRFGMGLPNSSISQCRRLEIWTWQSGHQNAIYSYLDVEEIENSLLCSVPNPCPRRLPKEWIQYSDNLGNSGTLVVWSKFDEHRLTWRRSQATLRNTEKIVGRMYRKFINGEKNLLIKLKSFSDGNKQEDYSVRVNDPLYLMENSSTPNPYDDKPMFQPWGARNGEELFDVSYNGRKHVVAVRMSYAREDTVPKDNSERGAKPYGQHAAKNIGVSIIREGRELDLDARWAGDYDPVERWWGAEIDFPSTLDEVFGVSNNKQSATVFSRLAKFDWTKEAEPNETWPEFRERLEHDEDPRHLLLPITKHIKEQLPLIRDRLKKQTKGRRRRQNRHDRTNASVRSTVKFAQRAADGQHQRPVDREEFTKEDSKKFEKNLQTDMHYSKTVAKEIAQTVFEQRRKVEFATKELDGYAFFKVERHHGGLTVIVFNTNHPVHDQILMALEPELEDDETDNDLLERIHKASDTFRLLFSAWARYEIEETAENLTYINSARQEWGKMAKFFLTDNDDEDNGG